MRCERCHGSMYVNGQPCQYCLGGQTSCCEGPVCEVPDEKEEEVKQPDLFDEVTERHGV